MTEPADPRAAPWYFGTLVCRCGAVLGESLLYRQGAGYRPLTKLAPGLIRLDPEANSGHARFGVRKGARSHPERASLRRSPLAPARRPTPDPRYNRRRKAVGGRGSEADPEIGPHAATQTWETACTVYCPGCGLKNRFDLSRPAATMPFGN